MINEVENGILIDVHVLPNSSKNNIIPEENGVVKVKLTAQPIENKANKALVDFLSKTFKIPKSSIEIVKGGTSKNKRIFIKTDSADKLYEIVNALH